MHVTYLGFRKIQLLGDFPPLRSTQVFLLAESMLQFANLFGCELGPESPLLGGLPLAVISRFTLGPRRIVASVWGEKDEKLNSFSQKSIRTQRPYQQQLLKQKVYL